MMYNDLPVHNGYFHILHLLDFCSILILYVEVFIKYVKCHDVVYFRKCPFSICFSFKIISHLYKNYRKL